MAAAQRDRGGERLVLVAQASGAIAAQFLIDLLWQQGHVRALAQELPGALPAVYAGDGPRAILVLESDREAAAFILAETDSAGELPPAGLAPRRRYKKHPPRA
jgi:hypothetical protein